MPANSADSMTALWAISTGQVVLNSGKPLMLSDIYVLVLILRKMNVLCDKTVFYRLVPTLGLKMPVSKLTYAKHHYKTI